MTNPNLHADFSGLSVGSDIAVIDISLQSMKGNTAFLVLLFTGELCTAETAGTVDLDTIGTVIHCKLDGALHSTAEADTALKLLSNALSHQLSIGLSAADFNDVNEKLFVRSQLSKLGTELVKSLPLLPTRLPGRAE